VPVKVEVLHLRGWGVLGAKPDRERGGSGEEERREERGERREKERREDSTNMSMVVRGCE
jgi:hypothetical protein